MSGSYCEADKPNIDARPNGRRGWLVTIIAATIAALLVPSISAIIIVSQMHQRQIDFDQRLTDHRVLSAHGKVESRLTENRVKLEGLERSLKATNEANHRLSERIYELQRSIRNSNGGSR